ncbi:hypothetical protein BH10PSE2_BH10PSE2_13370 [soil metagenome]
MSPPPDTTEAATVRRAFAKLTVGDAQGAYDDAQAVLKANRQSGPARMVLGRIAVDHANWRAAGDLFREAGDLAAAGSDRAAGWAQQARCLIALNRQDEARVVADKAEAALRGEPESPDPSFTLDTPHTLDTLGAVRSRTGDLAGALALFERASAARPANPAFLYNLGLARQFNGDLDGAEHALKAVLALDPEHARALSALVSLRRQTTESNALPALIALFRDDDPDPARQQALGHAIAKTHEDLGEATASLAWLARAKAGRRRRVGSPLDSDRRLFAAAKRTLAGHRARIDSAQPLFIVGLPRSGTTLVDRILSSHPDIASVGELSDFSNHVKRMADTASPRVLDEATLTAATGLDRDELGRRYLATLARQPQGGNGDGRLIDKMPLNVFYAGLIHEAMPNARILCLRRHPVDSALANYRQLFATDFPYYDYALDMADAGRYYALFDDLAAHWRETLPADRYTEVHYEAVVADLESEARRLIAFVGLDWDPACLEFHDNAAPVATASSVQVRSPIYSSSVGRWRRYGEAIRPLLDVLDQAGIAYD